MLEEKMRLIEHKHKEERSQLLDIINGNVMNPYKDTLNMLEKKTFINGMLDRARSKMEPLDPNIIAEQVASKLQKTFEARPIQTAQTDIQTTTGVANNPLVPKPLRTFIPKSDSDRVTNELINIKESIAKTLCK
jgi:hypothetical protein